MNEKNEGAVCFYIREFIGDTLIGVGHRGDFNLHFTFPHVSGAAASDPATPHVHSRLGVVAEVDRHIAVCRGGLCSV